MEINLTTFCYNTNDQELMYKSNKIVAFFNKNDNIYSCVFNTYNDKAYYNKYKHIASNNRLTLLHSYSGTSLDMTRKILIDILKGCRIYVLKDRHDFTVRKEVLDKFCNLAQKYQNESTLLHSAFSEFLWSFINDNENTLKNSMHIINNLLKDIIIEKV